MEQENTIDINLQDVPNRESGEESWTQATENLAIKWGEEAKKTSEAHAKAGLKHKFKHVVVGLPAALIPIVMAPVSSAFADEDGIEYVNMVGFLVSGALSAAHSFFSFDKKHQKHMDYSARYNDVYTDVAYEMALSRKHRSPPDRFLLRIQMKLDALGQNAPDL